MTTVRFRGSINKIDINCSGQDEHDELDYDTEPIYNILSRSSKTVEELTLIFEHFEDDIWVHHLPRCWDYLQFPQSRKLKICDGNTASGVVWSDNIRQ